MAINAKKIDIVRLDARQENQQTLRSPTGVGNWVVRRVSKGLSWGEQSEREVV